jgi:chromosome partitioning protein
MGLLFPFGGSTAKEVRGHRPGRVVAVCSVKGGVGKTTTSVNLAVSLALEEQARVLLMDCDAQGHASGCVAGLVPQASGGLADVLVKKNGQLSEIISSTSERGLDLVDAGQDLQASETALANRIGRETVLRGLLDVPRTHYDYVIIDCPPSLSLLAVGALVAADAVLVPCEPTPLAICGFETLLASLGDVRERLNPTLRLLGVVLTRVDARNKTQNREAIGSLREMVGDFLLNTSISASTEIARAQVHGRPTVLHNPRCRGAEQYRDLAAEVRRNMED